MEGEAWVMNNPGKADCQPGMSVLDSYVPGEYTSVVLSH